MFQNINEIISKNSFTSFLLCGDINCDFLRKTKHVKCVQSFLNENSLLRSWDFFDVDFTLCHEVQGVVQTSTLDHFFWNKEFSDQVLDAGVVYSPDNASDHSPIFCVVKIKPNQLLGEDVLPVGKKKPCWEKANPDQKKGFNDSLDSKLKLISVPDSVAFCKDVHCDNLEHQNDIDLYITEVLQLVEEEALSNLPVIQPKNCIKKKLIPGWSEQVKPFRDAAFFWNQVWKSAGKPLNTVLHEVMKRSRNVYHYQFKKCEKSKKIIQKNKLLDACINGDGDIFKEIKLIRRNVQISSAKMDGENSDIPGHFKNIYSKLYNTHDDNIKMKNIENYIQKSVNIAHLKDVEKVTPNIVKEAARHLNNNKSDPTYSFSSDCIKNGPDSLYEHLSAALRSFLIHGHVTLFLLLATLVPIIKDKLGSISSNKNYRSIAMSSLILKVLDWVIRLLFGESLGADQL